MKIEKLVPPKFPHDGSGYDDIRTAYKKVDKNFEEVKKAVEEAGSGGIADVTYDQLVALIAAGELKAGSFYRITDFQTVHIIPNTEDTNTGIIEPLIVTAISENKLMPEAYSVAFPGDVIYYSPDNDQTKVSGCTKGYIYRRVDTKQNNDFPFDFRQVKFRRWQISQPTWDETTSYSKGDVVKSTTNDTLWMSLVDGNTGNEVGSDNSFWRQFEWSNNSYPAWSSEFFPSDEVGWSLTPNENYQDYNMFAIPADYNSAISNKIDAPQGNIIEQCNTVIFGSGFYSNSIGSGFNSNSIGANFSSNSIGANFSSNSIGDNFYFNSIGAYFNYNSIGAGFYLNSIGSGFNSNSIGADFFSNSIGDNFSYNSIGASFYSNSIVANFNSNSIGSYFSYNSIGAEFSDNSIGDNFSYNSIGSGFNSNSIGSGFNSNSIGANFSSNSIGADFRYVTGTVQGVDFSLATHVYQNYPCEIFKRQDGQTRLRYVDNSDVQVIVNANA